MSKKKYRKPKVKTMPKQTEMAAEEIRFVKSEQWKPVFYPLFLFSTILLFASNKIIHPDERFFLLLKILTIHLVIIVAIIAIYWQWSHYISLQEYRQNPQIGKSTKKTVQSLIITLTFNFVTFATGALVLIYLFH